MRIHSLRLLRAFGCTDLVAYIYPRIFALHTLSNEVSPIFSLVTSQEGFPDDTGLLVLPPQVRASRQYLEDTGAYLLGKFLYNDLTHVENGQTMILYLGRNVVPFLLNDLFGLACNSLSDLNPLNSSLPVVDSQLSSQVRNILAYISETRVTRALHVQIARQTLDGVEHEFASLLVEDRNNEAQSYMEFLPFLHRQINLEVIPSDARSHSR